MKTLLDLDQKTLYTVEKALKLVRILQDGDLDGWTYKAIHPLDGRLSWIEVYDDEDIYVGTM